MGAVTVKINVPVPVAAMTCGANVHTISPLLPLLGDVTGERVPPVVATKMKPAGSVSVMALSESGSAVGFSTVSVKVTVSPATTSAALAVLTMRGETPQVLRKVPTTTPGDGTGLA